jgi:KH domain-containing RNA-binding signal transduction-associated protein 3
LNGSSSTRRGGEGGEQRRMVDITRDKPIKVTVRVVVPVRDHPKVSQRRALLAPEETMRHFSVTECQGHGSDSQFC